jgi:hypothetical protein
MLKAAFLWWAVCALALVAALSQSPAQAVLPFSAWLSPSLWSALFGALPPALGLLAAAAALGALALRAAGLASRGRGALAAALGLGALALVIQALSAAGLRAPGLRACGWAALLAACAAWRRRPFAAPLPPMGMPLLLLGLFFLYEAALALVPPTFYDSLHYQLALPEARLLGASTPAANVFAGIGGGLESLLLPLLAFDPTGVSAQLFNTLLLLLVFSALLACGRALHRPEAGPWAALLWGTCPMAALEATRAQAELLWAFYTLACLLALLSLEGRLSLALAGLLAGCAFGAKYQALAVLPAAWAFLWARDGRRAGTRHFARLTAWAALAAAPWLLRNASLFGDPLFPFLGLCRSWSLDAAGLFLSSEPVPHGGLADTLSGAAGALTRFWTDAFPHEGGYREKLLSPLFLAAAPLAVWSARRHPELRPTAAFGAALWAAVALVTRLTRYEIPAVAVLSLVAGAGLLDLGKQARPWIAAAAAALAVPVLLHTFAVNDDPDPWLYLRGELSRDAYLSRLHVGYACPPFPAYRWIDENLPPWARVLVSAEERSFGLRRPRLAASLYSEDPLARRANAAESGDALAAALAREGWGHLFVNLLQAERLRGQLTPSGQAALRAFWTRRLTLLHRDFREGPLEGSRERDAAVFAVGPPGRGNPLPYPF